MSSFEWDVFLSHSSLDKPRVARLAERLTGEGFKVWFDRDSIATAGDIVTEVERGLEKSRVLILCMTQAAFASVRRGHAHRVWCRDRPPGQELQC